jgi:hypothetical protein
MERFQTVNGSQDTMHPFGASELLRPPPEVAEALERARLGGRGGPGGVVAARDARAAEAVNYGPCLYFGPRGERCERRATATGFCARHSAAQAARNAQFWDAAAKPDVVEESDDESRAETGTPQDANAESIRKRSRILMLRALISFLHSK